MPNFIAGLDSMSIDQLRLIAEGLRVAPKSSIETASQQLLISWIESNQNYYPHYVPDQSKHIQELEDELSVEKKENEKLRNEIAKKDKELEEERIETTEIRRQLYEDQIYTWRTTHHSGNKTWNWVAIWLWLTIVLVVLVTLRICGLDITQPPDLERIRWYD